jgi:hypothetical protein
MCSYQDLTNLLQIDVYTSNLMPSNSTISLLSTPEVIAWRVSPAHQSTVAFPTAMDISANEKSASPPPTLPHALSPPVVVPPTSSHVSKLSNRYIRRDCSTGTVPIGQTSGKISCFYIRKRLKYHELTNRSQIISVDHYGRPPFATLNKINI